MDRSIDDKSNLTAIDTAPIDVETTAQSPPFVPTGKDETNKKKKKIKYVGKANRGTKNDDDDQGYISRSTADASKSWEITKTQDSSGRKVIKGRILNSIPKEILEDNELNQSISILPNNYNFEIHKMVHRLRLAESHCPAIQMPEGLLCYSGTIADIVRRFCPSVKDVIIMADVTYGACCVDDLSASLSGADFLIHYGHSCLVPINHCLMEVLYVFVDIQIDLQHFVNSVILQFSASHDRTLVPDSEKTLALVSTIQFTSSLQQACELLKAAGIRCSIPQSRPLSPGEILGCTSPHLSPHFDTIVYLADGRFHLESIMMSNPHLPAFQYNPYSKAFTIEKYDTVQIKSIRHQHIQRASLAKVINCSLSLSTLSNLSLESLLNLSLS